MELDLVFITNIARAVCYTIGAPASLTLAFLMMNDHSRYSSAFFFTNGALNMVWLVSLVLSASHQSDIAWRESVTPLVMLNTLFLCSMLVIRLRHRKLKDDLYELGNGTLHSGPQGHNPFQEAS